MKSEIGPAPVIRSRRRRGSNQASDVSTKPYGKTADELDAGAAGRGGRRRRPRGRARARGAPTSTKRPARKTRAAEADVRRDDEWRAVAARDQVAEGEHAGDRDRQEHHAGLARHQHAAALAVDRVDQPGRPTAPRARAAEQPRQRPPGSCRSRVPVTPASRPRSPRSASSDASRLGPVGPSRSSAAAMRSTSVRLPSSSSNSSASRRGHAHERVRAQVLEDEAALALARVEPLQRPARSARAAASRTASPPRDLASAASAVVLGARAAHRLLEGRRAGLDQQRAAGLVGAAHALDHELDLAHAHRAAVGDQRGASRPGGRRRTCRSVEPASTSERAVGPQLEPRVLARDGPVGELQVVLRRASDGRRGHQRAPRPSGSTSSHRDGSEDSWSATPTP